jgi:hypothetical protein
MEKGTKFAFCFPGMEKKKSPPSHTKKWKKNKVPVAHMFPSLFLVQAKKRLYRQEADITHDITHDIMHDITHDKTHKKNIK